MVRTLRLRADSHRFLLGHRLAARGVHVSAVYGKAVITHILELLSQNNTFIYQFIIIIVGTLRVFCYNESWNAA